MKTISAALAATVLALALAACASNPPPVYPDPPPKKPYDAKTQLESGRKY